MKSIAFWFIVVGALVGLAGMAWGIQMAISQDHSLAPGHAHNNLVGFVLMVLYGLYYKVVPVAAQSRLALVHFVLSLIGALTMGAGVAIATSGNGEMLAQVASVATILGMVTWIITIVRYRSLLSA